MYRCYEWADPHVPWRRSSTCRCGPGVSSCTLAADAHACPVAPPSGKTSLGATVNGNACQPDLKLGRWLGTNWGAFDRRLTSAFAGRDGGTLVLDVQSTRRVEDGVDEDVRLALLQQVQHLLQGQGGGVRMLEGEESNRWRRRVEVMESWRTWKGGVEMMEKKSRGDGGGESR